MRQGAGNAISIMGSRPTSNNFMIDGTSNVDTALGTPAAILSVDAIQEFKEQTTTYSAEYGFSANQINLVSKSGTNTFHGTVFGFMRNEAFDARNFFDSPTADKPQLDQKQFGGVIGGPIWHNKTFFLFNYEGTRIKRGFTSFATVPNPDNLAGHFSTHDHRPADRPAVPEQHDSVVALLTARAAGAAEQLVPGAEHEHAPGQLPARAHTPAGPGPDTRSASTTRSARYGQVFGRFTTRATPTAPRRQRARTSATGASCRTRRTGRSPTAGRSSRTS